MEMEYAERESYKKQLLAMRSRLMRAVSDIEEAIREDIQPPGEPSNLSSHPADHAGTIDPNVALAENEAEILEQVEDALERIENGTYGRCQNCNIAIDRDRLRAIPYAAYCLLCTAELEQEDAS
jgi:RNA polymerase-binding transcription factor DksA